MCEIVVLNMFFDDLMCKNMFKYLKFCYECILDEVYIIDVLFDLEKRWKRGICFEDVLRKWREKFEREKLLKDFWKYLYYVRVVWLVFFKFVFVYRFLVFCI